MCMMKDLGGAATMFDRIKAEKTETQKRNLNGILVSKDYEDDPRFQRP
jgi:hypothetical protein